MASLDEITVMLGKRLSEIPGMTNEDLRMFTETSFLEHGLRFEQEVPRDRILLILLYAQWDACLQVAFNSARFFSYKDGEESVDKRAVSEQYRRIAAELKKRYDAKKAEGHDGQTMFSIMTRADRP